MKRSDVKIAGMRPSNSKKSIIVELRQQLVVTSTAPGEWLDEAPTMEFKSERVTWVPLSKANKDKYKVGDTVPGNILVDESLTPFYDDQEPKKKPIEGEDSDSWPILTKDGQPIYRKSHYDKTGEKVDNLIEHNGETDSVETNPFEETESAGELF
jgi:hypothetical protein